MVSTLLLIEVWRIIGVFISCDDFTAIISLIHTLRGRSTVKLSISESENPVVGLVAKNRHIRKSLWFRRLDQLYFGFDGVLVQLYRLRLQLLEFAVVSFLYSAGVFLLVVVQNFVLILVVMVHFYYHLLIHS